MPITLEQKAEYLKNPGHCPFCGSSDIEGQGYDYDDNPAQRIDCQSCDKSWYDIFTLTDIEIIEDAPGASHGDFELSDGGCIEFPDDDGTIRRRDVHGNCEEVRAMGDDNWQEWASLFDWTPEEEEDEADETM